ncbi:MFS transporter [Corynebacterium sp. sy017]|uniref:MFS transporter n=1 Tax=unclassified Corynebacterium TaxID=2624378 RepID=UPI001185247A|nr:MULTISPECIES: MFS transporter [unclassified Corynebacterium]MBP3088493.1 MFS transporter [Corynebacterium sp. sy017]TSD91798.1 MFS transporter [Corynebacterium sp. SY003]
MIARNVKISGKTMVLAVALLLSSLVDEIFATAVLLKISAIDARMSVTLFLVVTIGALMAGPLSSRLLVRIAHRRAIIFAVFLCEGSVMALSATLFDAPHMLIFSSGLMGLLGALLWAVIMVIIADSFEGKHFDQVNSVITTMRNLGFVTGPACTGFLFHVGFSAVVALVAAIAFLSAALCAIRWSDIFPGMTANKTETQQQKKHIFLSGLVELLGDTRLRNRLITPLCTVFFGSVVNVGVVLYVLNMRDMGTMVFGAIGTAISTGLVLGPLALELCSIRLRTQSGLALGALLTALGIGGVFLPWSWLGLCLGGLLLGIGNGV